jgi:hypothetical protein
MRLSDLINSGKISNLTVWREPPQGFHIDLVREGIDEPIESSELFTSLEDALIWMLKNTMRNLKS